MGRRTPNMGTAPRSKAVRDMTETVGRISSLWRFPVKSMAGEQLLDAALTSRGFVGDRAYALIDVETGKVVSAKSAKRFPDILSCRAAFLDAIPRPGESRLDSRCQRQLARNPRGYPDHSGAQDRIDLEGSSAPSESDLRRRFKITLQRPCRRKGRGFADSADSALGSAGQNRCWWGSLNGSEKGAAQSVARRGHAPQAGATPFDSLGQVDSLGPVSAVRTHQRRRPGRRGRMCDEGPRRSSQVRARVSLRRFS